MTAIELRATIDIDRPAAIVWAVVSDYRLDPRWRRGVETMAPEPFGPVVATTTTREVLRLAGRTYRSDGLVVALDPGRSFAWRTVSGAQASGTRTVTEIDAGRSRVVLELRVVPTGRSASWPRSFVGCSPGPCAPTWSGWPRRSTT